MDPLGFIIIENKRDPAPNMRNSEPDPSLLNISVRSDQCIIDRDFDVERLSIDDPVPHGLKGIDDYSEGKRVALLAIRKK